MLKKIIAITVALGLGLACFSGGMVLSNNLKDDNYAIVLAEKKEDLDSILSQLQSLKDEIDLKDNELKNLQKEKDDLQQKFDELQQSSAQDKSELEKYKSQIEGLNSQIESQRTSLQTLQNQYNELEEDYTDLNSKYQQLLSQSKIDKQQIQSLNENISNLNSQISELEAEIEKLNSSQISDEIYKLVDVLLYKPIFIGTISDSMPDYYVVSFYNNQEEKYKTWGYDRALHSVNVLSEKYAITDVLIYKDKAYASVLSGNMGNDSHALVKVADSNYPCDFSEIHGDFDWYGSMSFILGTDIDENDCILLHGQRDSNDEEIILEINCSTDICQKEIKCANLMVEGEQIDIYDRIVLDHLGFLHHFLDESSIYFNLIRYVRGEFIKSVRVLSGEVNFLTGSNNIVWSRVNLGNNMFSNLDTNQDIQITDVGDFWHGLNGFVFDSSYNLIYYQSTDGNIYEIDVNTMIKQKSSLNELPSF